MMKMSKHQQSRMALEGVRRRLREKYPLAVPGKASNYIKYFEQLIREQPDLKVVLFGRVSACMQNHKGNLNDQLVSLRRAVEKYKVPIVCEFKEIGSGWWHERERLQAAARRAFDERAVILAESTDRFIRSIYYDTKKNPSAQPSSLEYEELLRVTTGVTLATMLHPDTPWKEVRSHQSKRGQQIKGNSGGRPKVNKPGYKKQRRLEKLSQVLQLRINGASWEDINALTGVAKTTAADWVRKYG